MKEKLVEFRERISALSPELERIPEAKQLIEEMLQEMNELHLSKITRYGTGY